MQRPTLVRNDIGEETTTWATVGTVIPCRLRQSNREAMLNNIASSEKIVAAWTVTMAFDADLLRGDRIIANGGTFEVLNSQKDESYLTAIRADCVKIE